MPGSLFKDGNIISWALGLISSFFLGLFTVLYRNDRDIRKNREDISLLKTSPPVMTVSACEREKAALSKHLETELMHGEQHFKDLEKKIADNHKEVKDQLNLILSNLLQ